MISTHLRVVAAACLLLAASATAQTAPPAGKAAPPPATNAAPAPGSPDDLSGMYSFLQEGEFVQLDIGDDGKVSGFVSSYGTLDSDRGAFLDHFLKSGSLQGNELNFVSAPVHGVWYEFKGKIERGSAKSRADEGYYVLKGTVTEYTTNEVNQMCGGAVECVWKKVADKTYGRSRDVTLKSFPQDVEGSPKQHVRNQ